MQKGNVSKRGGPRSWRKCTVCGKVIKGERKATKHQSLAHSK